MHLDWVRARHVMIEPLFDSKPLVYTKLKSRLVVVRWYTVWSGLVWSSLFSCFQ